MAAFNPFIVCLCRPGAALYIYDVHVMVEKIFFYFITYNIVYKHLKNKYCLENKYEDNLRKKVQLLE